MKFKDIDTILEDENPEEMRDCLIQMFSYIINDVFELNYKNYGVLLDRDTIYQLKNYFKEENHPYSYFWSWLENDGIEKIETIKECDLTECSEFAHSRLFYYTLLTSLTFMNEEFDEGDLIHIANVVSPMYNAIQEQPNE